MDSRAAYNLEPNLLQKMLEDSPSGIVLLERNIIRYANKQFCDMVVAGIETILGSGITTYVHPSYSGYLNSMLERISSGRAQQRIEAIFLTSNNIPINIALRGSLVAGDRDYIELVIDDITHIKRRENAIYYMTKTQTSVDTQINENVLNHIKHAIAHVQRKNLNMALFYVSINNFRFITESYGFHFSDDLLQAITQRFKKVAIYSETIIFLGGENFLVIVRELENLNMIENLIQKFMKVVELPYKLQNHEFIIGITAGISVYPENGVDAESLFINSRIAHEMAKEKHQKKYMLYTQDMAHNARKTTDLLFSLKQALENNDFQLYYQPVINAPTKEIIGYEALLRWVSNNELILPSAFLSFAEESGLLLNIGDWVIQQACHDNAEFYKKGLPIVPVSINLSNYQFDRPGILLKSIASALAKTGLNSKYLEFEVNENITVLDFVENTLNSIKDAGISLTIDNFGASYVSLIEIKRFDLNNIKIDQKLVSKLPQDETIASVVRAIIAMAKQMNIQVIAEGVETREQYQFLQENGCYLLQGNYICPPVAAQTIAKLLSGQEKLPIMKEEKEIA